MTLVVIKLSLPFCSRSSASHWILSSTISSRTRSSTLSPLPPPLCLPFSSFCLSHGSLHRFHYLFLFSTIKFLKFILFLPYSSIFFYLSPTRSHFLLQLLYFSFCLIPLLTFSFISFYGHLSASSPTHLPSLPHSLNSIRPSLFPPLPLLPFLRFPFILFLLSSYSASLSSAPHSSFPPPNNAICFVPTAFYIASSELVPAISGT